MKKTAWMIIGAALLLAGASVADAQSNCCATAPSDTAPEYQGKRCQKFDTVQAGGCQEDPGGSGSCIGGGISEAGVVGCVCIGDVCVSDGSVGSGDGLADDRTCTRDAVAGCCEAGHCEGDSPPESPVPDGEACAGPEGGIAPHAACSTGCCITVIPVPNDLRVGAGLCVSDQFCQSPIDVKACSSPSPGFSPNADCPTNCCLTALSRTAGLCVPSDFCS